MADNAVETLLKEWGQFKNEHTQAQKAAEAAGQKLSADTEARFTKWSEEIGKKQEALQTHLDDLEAKMQRPAAGGGGEGDGVKQEHAKAFNSFLRKGQQHGLRDLEKKAVNISVDAEGAFAVPEELQRFILEVAQKATPMLALVNQVTGSTETYEQLVNAGGAISGWVDESTDERGETDSPKLESVKPLFGEVYAMPGTTQRALDDLFFSVEGWLATEVGRSFGKQIDAMIVSGNGTKKGKGLLAATMAETDDETRPFGTVELVKSGAAAAITADGLLDLANALDPMYEVNARWLMHKTTIAKIRKLKDTDGNYLWQPGLQNGQPQQLLGYPLTAAPNVPKIAADAYAAMFGDFARAYTVVNLHGTRVIRDDVTKKGKVLFYTARRIGGNVFDTLAYKVLKIAA